jgi:uracil-DNA glycosylase family 4
MNKADELTKLYQEIFNCRCCQPKVFASEVPRRVLENTLNSEIVLMAQAPGESGVRISGVHWNREDGTLTKGGSFLDKQLSLIKYSVNLDNNAIPRPYTSNILQCWTGRAKHAKRKRDRELKDTELKYCAKWWRKELEIIGPKIMVLLGKPATEYFAKAIGEKWFFADMLRRQGEYIKIGDMELKVFFLPHPTAGYKEHNVPNPRKQSQIYQEVLQQVKENLNFSTTCF